MNKITYKVMQTCRHCGYNYQISPIFREKLDALRFLEDNQQRHKPCPQCGQNSDVILITKVSIEPQSYIFNYNNA